MTIVFNPTPCERAAEALAAVEAAARKAPDNTLPDCLDDAARPCFTQDNASEDCLLGALVNLHLPTLNLPPPRAVLLADWLTAKVDAHHLQPLESGPEYYVDSHDHYRCPLEHRWHMCRWWAEQTEYPHLRAPFAERANKAANRMKELPFLGATLIGRMWRTPSGTLTPIANRLKDSPVMDWEEPLSTPPDWGAKLTCEAFEYDAGRLAVLDIVVAQPPHYFRFEQSAFIEHLRKWAEGEPSNYDETKDAIGDRLKRLLLMRTLLSPLERARPGWGLAEPLTWVGQRITDETQRRELAPAGGSFLQGTDSPTMGLRQIALLYVYENRTMQKYQAPGIAQGYGHKYGGKLYDHYTTLGKTSERVNVDGQKLTPMIKDITAVIAHLSGAAREQAERELRKLETAREAERKK